MTKAAGLIKGFKYEVARGLMQGHTVTIVDNTTFPDGHPHARKLTVKFEDGSIDYIMPRHINETPVGIENPALVSIDPYIAPVFSEPTDTNIVIGQMEVAPEPVTVMNPETHEVKTAVYQMVPITDPMDERLDHLRPSRKKVKKYINRIMKNGMKDTDFLLTFTTDAHRVDNELRPANIMLKGDTQSGKTFMVEVLAVMWSDKMADEQRARGEKVTYTKPMPIFTLSGSAGVTDFDLFGQTTSYTDPETGIERLVQLPGIVTLAAMCGGILYLDECNAMAERVTSSLHPLADHRHAFTNRNCAVWRNGQFMPEVIMGHEDLWIIGTYNEGYAGMGKMNEAFQNRFRHLRWDYDEAVEAKLITSPTVRLLGDALRTARKSNSRGIRTPVGTAALQRCVRDIESFGVEMALEIFVGMFQPQEADVVETIIVDRTIIDMLIQEEEQRAAEAAVAAGVPFMVVGTADDLLNMLD